MTAEASERAEGQPAPPMLDVRHVDPQGRIQGLDAWKNRDLVLLHVPGWDRKRFEAGARQLEEQAAKLARQFDLDEQQARSFVRSTTQGAMDTLRGAVEAFNRLSMELQAEAREAGAEARSTASEVASSMRGGLSAITTRASVEAEAREERRTLGEVATAAMEGEADWKPRSGPPEAASPESSRSSRDESPGEGTARKPWKSGAGGT